MKKIATTAFLLFTVAVIASQSTTVRKQQRIPGRSRLVSFEYEVGVQDRWDPSGTAEPALLPGEAARIAAKFIAALSPSEHEGTWELRGVQLHCVQEATSAWVYRVSFFNTALSKRLGEACFFDVPVRLDGTVPYIREEDKTPNQGIQPTK